MMREVAEPYAVLENKFLDEIARSNYLENVEGYFETEDRMLKYLYRFEKQEAIDAADKLIQIIKEGTKNNAFIGLKYYLIMLSGIMSRHISKEYLASRNALSFNAACLLLIEQRLTEENGEEVAANLIELFMATVAPKKTPILMHHTVNNVVQYIDREVEVPMSVEGLSTMFDVSTSHLSRIFREHTGITLVEYINIRKVEEAQYYLRFSEVKISDISNKFHFCNQSYFTRIFKKYTGETPRKFRNNLTGPYFHCSLPIIDK